MNIKIFSTAVVFFCILCNSVLSVKGSPLDHLAGDEKKVPIVMYHNVLDKKSLLGKFVITPDELEQDLIYLKENGYETIFMNDLISFVDESEDLPEKPVLLTFDDGDFAIVKYVLPLLEKYDMKAVVSIIGKVTDDYSDREKTENYPNLTWKQIGSIIESGHIEVQNHTYDMHKKNGAQKLRGESEERYRHRLTEDLQKMQERMYEMTQYKPNTLTYPYGILSPSSNEIIKDMGFKASLSCRERVNTLRVGQSDCLFSLGRFLRPHGVKSDRFFSKIEELLMSVEKSETTSFETKS